MEQILLDFDLRVMAPEWVIVSAAALLSIIDLLLKESTSRKWIGWLGLVAVAVAGFCVAVSFGHKPYQILADTYRIDSFSLMFKEILLAGTAGVFLFSLMQGEEEWKTREGEYYYLLLTALLGGMVMVSSADLITLFVGLELLSLSSYILVGIRKERVQPNEAAWKYVVLGGVSSAFILYGMSFVYGMTGSTNLFEINQRFAEGLSGQGSLYIYLSLFLMMVGFGFKIAVAPFHTWAPDVYQGASTPIAAFLAIVSKTAALAFIIRILLIAYSPLMGDQSWMEVVSRLFMIVAALSMILGNTIALKQTNAKRLMAYSSVAQAGYLIVPFATVGLVPFDLFPSLLFYLVAYLFMTLGAFVVIECVSKERGNEEISAFAGLHRRSPWLAAAMTLFLISLAGLPLTAGFFGKFYLITSAFVSSQKWLAAVMILTTIVSYYYYFGIVRQMYFRPPCSEAKVAVPWVAVVVILLGVGGTIGLGLFPEPLLTAISKWDWTSGLSLATNGMQK
ncbi:NADH-quinone oxidoreductase subunit N [Laceyella putida]|uniref:NADH-quinone oxidoreductase subunit N n=1 Tax=Laceyella putida TaxID=110101 RepID=A0ABW2RGE8_9BACL